MTNSRASWDEVWLRVAYAVSDRSLCVRAKIGAVIVDHFNRIVATGYNGPPAGFQHDDLPCSEWCDRGASTVQNPSSGHIVTTYGDIPNDPKTWTHEPVLEVDYSDCPALHAEANALSVCDRSVRDGGTMYVMGGPCFTCAKLIANSGLYTVVIGDENALNPETRQPGKVVEFLDRCGIEVVEAFK